MILQKSYSTILERVFPLITGIVCCCAFCCVTAPLTADTVFFTDGNRVENVRVLFAYSRVNLIFEDGSVQSYRESKIARIVNAPVAWDSQADKEEFERRARRKIAELVERIESEQWDAVAKIETLGVRALGRSALIPGWGQWYLGDRLRGSAYFLGAAFGMHRVYSDRQALLRARDEYNDLTLPALLTGVTAGPGTPSEFTLLANTLYFSGRRDDLAAAASRDRQNLGVLLVFWLWNAADAYIFRGGDDRLRDFERHNGPVELGVIPEACAERSRCDAGKRMQISLLWRF